MPGPYRAAMGKWDFAVSFGGVRAPRPTHGFLSRVVGRPALWPPRPLAAAGSARPLHSAVKEGVLMSKHIQTQTEWEQTMARRVMEQLRGELYLDQRYLTAALGALPPAPAAGRRQLCHGRRAAVLPHRMAAGHLPQKAAGICRAPTCTACSTASSGISGCGISATPTCGASPVILRWKARWTP
mgnify:CR=1 FL=1